MNKENDDVESRDNHNAMNNNNNQWWQWQAKIN